MATTKQSKEKEGLTSQEQELLQQARLLQEMCNSQGYQQVFLPYLMALAQQDYPNPQEYKDKPKPQESLLLDYTYAVGGTDKIKKIIEFLKEQDDVAKRIVDKYKKKEEYENAI